MIQIQEYKEEYAKELSEIILSNMYKINIIDHGKEIIDKIAVGFTEDAIKNSFPNRTKCFVATENGIVVGTASIDRFWGDETGHKYIILTVFVSMEHHHKGIGKMLIQEIEKFANKIGVKELVIPASVHACEFYRKLGYDYINGIKEQNEEKEYMLVKRFDN